MPRPALPRERVTADGPESAQRPSERSPSGPRRRRPPPRPCVPVRFWPVFISPHFSSRAREDALLSCSKLYPRPGQGSLCLRGRGHCGHACHTAAGKPGWGRGALPWPPRAHPTAPHTPPSRSWKRAGAKPHRLGCQASRPEPWHDHGETSADLPVPRGLERCDPQSQQPQRPPAGLHTSWGPTTGHSHWRTLGAQAVPAPPPRPYCPAGEPRQWATRELLHAGAEPPGEALTTSFPSWAFLPPRLSPQNL